MDGLTAAQREAVEGLLSKRFGSAVRVSAVHTLQRGSAVWRCALDGAGAGVPVSVIVRTAQTAGRRAGLAPLRSERAALELLEGIGSTVAPRVYGADDDALVLATEDLGNGPLLLDVLLGDDAAAARRGMVAFGRALGELRAQTTGRKGELDALRASYGASAGGGLGLARLGRVGETWPRVRDEVARLGLPAPVGLDAEVKALEATFDGDHGAWALSSGDPAPLNCKIVGGEAKLFDFEYGGFRHGALDVTALRYAYPTGAPPWSLPQEVLREAEGTYREAALQACPHLGDDTAYEREAAGACVAWTLLRLERLELVESGPDGNDWPHVPPSWVGPVPRRSRRHQLVATIEVAAEAARRAGAVPALAGWFAALVVVLRERWVEARGEASVYPAFK